MADLPRIDDPTFAQFGAEQDEEKELPRIDDPLALMPTADVAGAELPKIDDPLGTVGEEEIKLVQTQQRNVTDFVEWEEAKGPLIKLFNMAFPVETGVATDLALHEVYPEAMITSLIASGEIEIPDYAREALAQAGDDDIRIYPAMDRVDPGKWYGWLWTGKGLQTEKGKFLHKSAEVARDKLLDQPLILELTTSKEVKTKKKFFSGKTKEKIKSRETIQVELPYTQRQVNAWLEEVDEETGLTRRETIREEAWGSFKAGLTSKDVNLKKRLANGDLDLENAGMVTLSQIMVSRGHKGWLAHRVASVVMSVMILEPFDLAGALSPLNQAGPAASALDDALGVWAKTNPSQALIKMFGTTKPGRAMMNLMNNWTPTRWAARYFDWMPVDQKKIKSVFMHTKSKVATGKVTIRQMGNELWNEMHAAAKKTGKKLNPIYNDKVFTNFLTWLHGGGTVTLDDWFKQGKTFSEFITHDPARWAKILRTTPEKLASMFTVFDERKLLRAFENGALDHIRFLKSAQELGDAAIAKFGTSTDPEKMGYVLRDGTALNLGFTEHNKVRVLKGIDQEDSILDFLQRTGSARIQVEGSTVTVKTASNFTKEQLDTITKGLQRSKNLAQEHGGVPKIIIESTNPDLKIAAEKATDASGFYYVAETPMRTPVGDWVKMLFKDATVEDIPWQLQQFEATFEHMKNIQMASESMKLDAEVLDAKAVRKGLDEGKQHLPHRKVGQQVKKGDAFRTTDASIAAAKKRIHATFDEYEMALLQSGDSPQYSLIRVFMEDAEESANELLQKLVEDRAEDVGAMVKVLNSPGIRNLKEAKKIIATNKKYLDPMLKVTDDNAVDVANSLIDHTNIRRIKDLLDEGITTIRIRDAHKIDLTALGKPKGLKGMTERGYGAYFPRSRMKIFARNIRKEMLEKAEKLSPEVQAQMKVYLDELGVMLKKPELNLSDLAHVMEMVNEDVVKAVAPKSVLSITRKTPMNLVSEDVGRFIRQEVRTVSDQDVGKILGWLSRRERGFMAAVTTYNPNFWRKYLMTDAFQLFKGGVKPWMIGARAGQGALQLTGKGFTTVNGVKMANREFLKLAEEAGVRRHIRQLMSINNFDILSKFADDVLSKRRVMLMGKKVVHLPTSALTHADDMFRMGLYTDRLEYLMKFNKVTTKAGMLDYVDEAAEWTWRHMFNYDDLPQALRKARAFIPFLSWQRHIVPDMLKFALDLRKIKQLAKGHLAIQSFIGKPEVPAMADYLERSPEFKWKMGDKLYRTNLNLPYMNVLNFGELSQTFERMFGMLNPYLKLPLILAMNLQTFPRLKFYKDEKVPAPISMYWAYQKLWDNPWFQKRTGASLTVVKDEDDLTAQAYVTVSKKFYDLYHIAFPQLIPIDENTKNMKLFVPMDQFKVSVDPDAVDPDKMFDEQERRLMSLNIKTKPNIKFIRTRPGLVTREVDVEADVYRKVMRIRSLAGTVATNAQNIVEVGKGFKQLDVNDVASVNEPYLELLELYVDLRDDLANYPEEFGDIINDLDRLVTNLTETAKEFLVVENEIHFAPIEQD